ncbi:MAG: polysaccharide deacetylase family protein [bacterium]
MHAWFTRSRIISVLVLLLFLAAVALLLNRSKTRPVRIPILMYHKIGNAEDSPWWVATRDFENHLKGLRAEGYRSILPSDLVAHMRWGWPLPTKPVIITFDDGYLNILENAEPLLKQTGFRGVCYLITGRVGDSPLTRTAYEGIPTLTWPEVRAMQARGSVVFGGHSRSHANLRALADPRDEIVGCYRDLRKRGGFAPEGFCYPYGQYGEATLACVSRSRFTTAVTCEDGIATTGRTNLLELPRVSVMGGWHRFHAERVDAVDKTVSVRVSKEGRGLEAHPRLAWTDAKGKRNGDWLAPIQMSAIPVLLKWKHDDARTGLDPELELWDNFHVVRYWCQPLSALSVGRRE